MQLNIKKYSNTDRLLVVLLLALSASTILGLLSATIDDRHYIETLSEYRLPTDFRVRYKVFEYGKFQELTHQIKTKTLEDKKWQETGIPSIDWQQFEFPQPKLVVYRFRFDNPPQDKQWAFAPIIISHTKYWAYQGNRQIESTETWQNNKRIIIFPVSTVPGISRSKEKAKIVITLVAQLDKNAHQLGSIFGYFYGPYEKFPRISYQIQNIGRYSLIVFIVGTFLTILLILLVLILPSHKGIFNYLILYSLFFNVFAVLPYVFFHLEYASEIYFSIRVFQSIGLVCLGLYLIECFQLKNKDVWKYYFAGFIFAFVLAPSFYPSADTLQMQLRVFFLFTLSFMLLKHVISIGTKKVDSEAIYKVYLLVGLLLADLVESIFFHNIFFNRFQTFHLLFFTGFIILSIRKMRQKEIENTNMKETELKYNVLNNSFNILEHDLMHPFNKMQISLLSIVKNKKIATRSQFVSAMSDLHQEISVERNYVNSMVSAAKDALKHQPTKLEYLDIAKVLSESNLNIFESKQASAPEFFVKAKPTWVYTDSAKLLRITRNIIKNAIYVTSGNTKISLQVVEKKRFVLIRIHNTNSEIPQNIIDNLFEPYVSTRRNSLGLGLFICKTLVDNLKGTIAASNVEDGVVFDILLPK